MNDLKIGDKITISGFYAKRTFWQWLTRKPKELKVSTIAKKVSS